MITIRIGGETRSLVDATESWITEQINRRRHDGQSICVEVTINTGGLNMRLTTPGCVGAGGGGRPPNGNEQKIFDLWSKLGLDAVDFAGGNVVAFLKQLKRLVG